jgi:hypothetical protein
MQHELTVLQGGLGVLSKFRPILVMELSPYVHAEEHNSFAARALLRNVGTDTACQYLGSATAAERNSRRSFRMERASM